MPGPDDLSPAPHAPSPAPALPSPALPVVHGWRGLGAAFVAPFRGCFTILGRPGLWPLAVTPTLVFLALAGLGSLGATGVFRWVHGALSRALGERALSGVGLVVGDAVAVVALVLLVVLLAVTLVPPLAAPFMDALAARIDARAFPDEPLSKQVARSVRVALAGLFMVGIPQLAVGLLSLVVPFLSPLWLVLGGSIAALGLAYDALDWPLARRSLGVRERLRWMRRHRAPALGLGLAAWVLSLVPGLSLVLLPALVVAGVRVVNAVEAREGPTRPELPPPRPTR